VRPPPRARRFTSHLRGACLHRIRTVGSSHPGEIGQSGHRLMNTTPRGAVSAHHPPPPASAQGEHHVAVIGSGPGRPARQCVDNARRSGAMAGTVDGLALVRGLRAIQSANSRPRHLNWAMTLALGARCSVLGARCSVCHRWKRLCMYPEVSGLMVFEVSSTWTPASDGN
jgi:hypothetical protein